MYILVAAGEGIMKVWAHDRVSRIHLWQLTSSLLIELDVPQILPGQVIDC